MKKKIAILLVLVILAGLLAGCGKLKGTYVPVDDYSDMSSITFDGKNIKLGLWGYDLVTGTYKVKGDKITISYVFWGDETEDTYSFKKKGNSIFIDDEEYVKQGSKKAAASSKGSSKSGGSALTTLLVILFVVFPVIAVVVLVLMRKKIPWVDSTVDKVMAFAKKTGKEVSVQASDMGKRVSSTVSAGVAAGSAAFREEKAKQQIARGWTCPSCGTVNSVESRFCSGCGEQRPVLQRAPAYTPSDDGLSEFPADRRPAAPKMPDRSASDLKNDESTGQPAEARRKVKAGECCVCGAPLGADSVKLFDHPHGVEARLCKKCHTAMYVLASTKDMAQFENANKYLRYYMNTSDAVVAKSIDRFLSKSEARIYSDMMGE